MATAKCTHVKDHQKHVKPHTKGCEECLKTGDTWVHLRMCLECGKVGCCDSSKNRHATAHFHADGHPILRSVKPGQAYKLKDGGWRKRQGSESITPDYCG